MNKNQELEIIKSGIRQYVPRLAEFIDCDILIKNYSANLYKVKRKEKYLKRQVIIKDAIKKQCAYLFGEEAKNFQLNLEGPIIANICDHNGILNNPILVNSHIIAAASNIFDRKFDILSLNTAFYPFNNPFYKKGLRYKNKVIPFVSENDCHQLVYYAPPVTFSEFPVEIRAILEEVEKVKSKYAWEQASRMNFYLWPKMFEQSLRPRLPRLITLNRNEIDFMLLINLIKNKDNFVYDSIFNKEFRTLIQRTFQNSTGTWGDGGKGSFLFWAVDEKNRGVSLKLEGDYLVSIAPDFTYKIKLTEPEILNALNEKRIYPGMFLIFGSILFYSGIIPLAGYGSVNYLNVMKDNWLKVLKNPYPDEYNDINEMIINGLVGGPVLTYYRDENKKIQQGFMLDLVMSGGLKKDYLEKMLSMKFSDLLLVPLIDIYNTYIPREMRKPITIRPDDIISEQLTWL